MFILISALFLFVLNKQVKVEVQKQPFKCVPREKKVGEILEKKLSKKSLFGKVVGCRPAN